MSEGNVRAAGELALKYGCNPNQKPSRIFIEGQKLPITVLCGKPGYINFLDALNGWQLVRELKQATALPAAASFKHVSPAGAAVGLPLSDTLKKVCFVEQMELTPLACAYARARGADRLCSFGDWIALSDECDEATARLIAREVSDGVIAPSYSDGALAILRKKRGGAYNVVTIDEAYSPRPLERKEVFGITFEQGRNELVIDKSLLVNVVTRQRQIPAEAARDLLIALIALKYTQSNSVCYCEDGQVIGVGAGQQSRIHCTRLAGDKADSWHLRQHPKVLALDFSEGLSRPERDNAIDVFLSGEWEDVAGADNWMRTFASRPEPLTAAEKEQWLAGFDGVALGSDAFFPFGDNVERARRSGVKYIAQPGGSIRDDNVIAACDKYGIAMAFTGVRLFHH
jgi:phosphoribosylaminoimidazolecarboxamide formyltransferase/IMP cyclohydrolase